MSRTEMSIDIPNMKFILRMGGGCERKPFPTLGFILTQVTGYDYDSPISTNGPQVVFGIMHT